MPVRFGEQAGNFASGLFFASQDVFISAADIFGSGDAQAQSATVAGTGVRGSVSLGTPPAFGAGPTTVVGVGVRIVTGAGVLQAQSADVTGVGGDFSLISGSGALITDRAVVNGSGSIGIGGEGVLQVQSATVVGIGALVGVSIGSGDLAAQSAVLSGLGDRGVIGNGQIFPQNAQAFGSGVIIEFAVDYVSFLQVRALELQKLDVSINYPSVNIMSRNIPRSLTADWDAIVQYHAGVEPETDVAYTFSNGRKFVKDR